MSTLDGMSAMQKAAALRHYTRMAAAATLDEDETIAGLRYLIDTANAAAGKAERALASGDVQLAIDTLQSVGRELAEADWT